METGLGKDVATFEGGLDHVLAEVREIILSKQHDYGHDNILRSPIAEISQGWGVKGIDETMSVQLGIFTRLCDKIARLKSAFIRAGDMKNESMSDSWTDVIGYAVLAKMVAHNTFQLSLANDIPYVFPSFTHASGEAKVVNGEIVNSGNKEECK